MAFLEASAQCPVALSLEWGAGSIKLGGKEDAGGGNAPGRVVEVYHLSQAFCFVQQSFSSFEIEANNPDWGWSPAWELGAFITEAW